MTKFVLALSSVMAANAISTKIQAEPAPVVEVVEQSSATDPIDTDPVETTLDKVTELVLEAQTELRARRQIVTGVRHQEIGVDSSCYQLCGKRPGVGCVLKHCMK